MVYLKYHLPEPPSIREGNQKNDVHYDKFLSKLDEWCTLFEMKCAEEYSSGSKVAPIEGMVNVMVEIANIVWYPYDG